MFPIATLFCAMAAAQATPPASLNVQAYVPLLPLKRVDPIYPDPARQNHVGGLVSLLLTVDAEGNVDAAEVLVGPRPLRQAAIDAAMQFRYQPVLRHDQPVPAYTSALVSFRDANTKPYRADRSELDKAKKRTLELRKRFPRSQQQVLADLEQDSRGGDEHRRVILLPALGRLAAEAGAFDQANAYAAELLASTAAPDPAWAIHEADTVLGLVALKQGDFQKAGGYLLKSGQIDGSSALASTGPEMALANELLRYGQIAPVFSYLKECEKFAKPGSEKLDDWRERLWAQWTWYSSRYTGSSVREVFGPSF